eukprot:TRINITY_DN604_c0_g1_i2.p1 TRINITY_DN604_c0_g1~~TRINITY_DN604_c0_g1_i2.p1  ORF type:complete len:587 (-),score=73.38 TRINITY_DN604_c0_g1_i2:115-1812(-)
MVGHMRNSTIRPALMMCCWFAFEVCFAAASVALTVAGGGWRAQWSAAGLISGMVSYMGKTDDSTKPTLAGTGLLDRIDIVSSNSGGSWFASSLIYSERHLALLESMAASPETASAQAKSGWVTPWLQATQVEPKQFDLVGHVARDLVALILGKGDEDTIYLFNHFLATGLTWNDWTITLLSSTASIGTNITLGSSPNSWAKGKEWFACHSVMLPTAKNPASLFRGAVLGLPQVNHFATKVSSTPELLPAKFSVKLGAGATSSATRRYMPSSAASLVQRFDYKAVIAPIVDEPSAQTGPVDTIDLTGGVFSIGAGTVPVFGAASASSAAAGIAPTLGALVDETISLIDADLLPWVTNATGGDSFLSARKLYKSISFFDDKNDAIKALASADFHGLIDGGYTDNTAIAHALAEGADEVLAVLNKYATGTPASLDILFKDGPPPHDPGSSSVIYPVFESPTFSDMKAQFAKFHELVLPGTTAYLKSFHVGTIAATTAPNEYFGITGGRSVSIHVMDLGSVLSIGQFEDITRYGDLAQEIIQTITSKDNAAFVQSTLLPMFLGQKNIVI